MGQDRSYNANYAGMSKCKYCYAVNNLKTSYSGKPKVLPNRAVNSQDVIKMSDGHRNIVIR